MLFNYIKQNCYIVEQNNPGCENIHLNYRSDANSERSGASGAGGSHEEELSRPSESSTTSTYETNQNFELVFNLNQVQDIISILQLVHSGSTQRIKFDQVCQKLETFNSKQASFSKEFTGKPIPINRTNKTVLIRKHDLNQYMSLSNSTKPRLLAKLLDGKALFPDRDRNESEPAESGLPSGSQHAQAQQPFIDNMDLEMLKCKQTIDAQYYKQPLTKWMNTAWDSFRIVDNNTNNVIFMLPDDPLSPEFLEYASKVQNPTINLETIR